MGLFSFLSGSKEAGAATADKPEEQTLPPTSSADTANPAPVEGWDTGALTAPPAPKVDAAVVGPADPALTAAMQAPIIDVIKTVYDPEIPVDIYELGLIYDIIVDAEKRVHVKMTLTSPACPSAQQLPSEVRYKIKAMPDVADAVVEVVWEPPWDKDRMSEAAKLQLGFF
jgi:FeS assembly SUF system protein